MEENTEQNPEAENVGKSESSDENVGKLRRVSKKKILVLSLITSVLVVFAIVAILGGKDDTSTADNGTQAQQETVTEGTLEEPKSINTIFAPSFDGLAFEVPEGWVLSIVERLDSDPTYTFYSSDAENSGGAYIEVAKGLSVAIRESKRDTTEEAKYDKPEKAYVSYVGAPKIKDDDVDFFQQETDFSKFVASSNPNNVEFYSYAWGYEGCFLDTIFLDETTAYHVIVKRGLSCPTPDLMDTNEELSAFLDSISFGDTEEIAVSALVQRNDPQKEEPYLYEVNVKDLRFRFSSVYEDHGRTVFQPDDGIVLPKLNDDGSLDFVEIGVSEANSGGPCEGCGFIGKTYDSTLSFEGMNVDLSGYTKVQEGIYGKTTNDAPVIQPDGMSRRYHFYVQDDSGAYFSVSFIVEIGVEDVELPTIDEEYLLTGLGSLTTVSE